MKKIKDINDNLKAGKYNIARIGIYPIEIFDRICLFLALMGLFILFIALAAGNGIFIKIFLVLGLILGIAILIIMALIRVLFAGTSAAVGLTREEKNQIWIHFIKWLLAHLLR